MTSATELLTRPELKKFDVCPVECPRVRTRVSSLAQYFGVISGTISGEDSFWFRGHADVRWSLTPSALRFPQRETRTKALHLMEEFKRIADMKLLRPPAVEQELMWAQLAQHYGLPTRLLDWRAPLH
ncbi:MAG: FRG domain-containing protein [Janthinobacterium lividum]